MPCKKSTEPADRVIAAARPATVDPERVEQTLVWLLDGARDAEILASVAEHWPGQSTEALLLAVAGKLSEAAETDPDLVRGFCIEATRNVYQKMLAVGDLTGALRAIKQLAELSQ